MFAFGRYTVIKVISADHERVLRKLADNGVLAFGVECVGSIEFCLTVKRKDCRKTIALIQNCGAASSILYRGGLLERIFSSRKRPVLCLGIILFLLFSLLLPTRICFVRVEGNVHIPSQLIISQAESCGIKFGSLRREVRSEKVKNALLAMNDELQWVGVNTSGCIATIHVKERSQTETNIEEQAVSSMIARYSGLISSITVLEGTPLCEIGKKVHTGDTLISGYSDHGLITKAGNAAGEVFAYTLRRGILLSPRPIAQKGSMQDKHICCRLRIGKKLINLCNHSGISGITCDKMYVEKYWTLPGGFELPIALICLEETVYTLDIPDQWNLQSGVWLKGYAAQYIMEQMIAGKVLHEKYDLICTDDFVKLTGNYSCEEMIGQMKYEETLDQNAEDY